MQWDTPWKCQTQTSCGCHAAGGLRKPCAWEHKKVTATHSEILINTVNKLCCGAQRPGLIFLKSIKKYKKNHDLWFLNDFSLRWRELLVFHPVLKFWTLFKNHMQNYFALTGRLLICQRLTQDRTSSAPVEALTADVEWAVNIWKSAIRPVSVKISLVNMPLSEHCSKLKHSQMFGCMI